MITLSKAKEILNLNITEAGLKMPADTYSAVIIAISAITAVQLVRQTKGVIEIPLLPGEEPATEAP